MTLSSGGCVGRSDRKRFVVLDRDGTIIEEKNYLSDPDGVALLDGAVEGLRLLRESGLGLAVITNQSGIGRGYFDLGRLDQIHQRMTDLLEAQGVDIDGIYSCPHIPSDGCTCRKPETDLIDQASQELDFDSGSCFVIGDKGSDIELGQRVGATTFLVATGYGAETMRDESVKPDYTVERLDEAAEIIRKVLQPDQRA